MVFPSFAFRFDSDEGSVVFSGDTGPTPNVAELAGDADLLVHEVIDFPLLMRLGSSRHLLEELRESHTELSDVHAAARTASVANTVLTHLIPADPRIRSQKWWQQHASKTFTRPVIVGHDGLQVPVRPRR